MRMTRSANGMSVVAQLLTFCAPMVAGQDLPAAWAHRRSLEGAAAAGFIMNYGSCRSCAELDADLTNKGCANNADGPALGLFTTIGFSDFEPNANATSNKECAALCSV